MKKTFLLILIVLLNGCSGAAYHSASISVNSARNLNSSDNNRPTAIRLHVYQLTKSLPFSMLSYSDLELAPYKLLGASLVDKSDYYIKPNTRFNLNLNLQASVKFIAVIAGFHHSARKKWKAIMSIPEPAFPWLAYFGFYKHLHLSIDLHRDSLSLNN